MLGDNIAALRKQRSMTQQSLADALYVTRQTISKWEKNLSVPDADALIRLADALETTVQSHNPSWGKRRKPRLPPPTSP